MRGIFAVMLVDADETFGNQLREAIDQSGGSLLCVASCKTFPEALQSFRLLQPDLVVVTCVDHGPDLLKFIKHICAGSTNTTVVVVGNHIEYEYVRSVFRSGAHDYILKDTPPERILISIEEACSRAHGFPPRELDSGDQGTIIRKALAHKEFRADYGHLRLRPGSEPGGQFWIGAIVELYQPEGLTVETEHVVEKCLSRLTSSTDEADNNVMYFFNRSSSSEFKRLTVVLHSGTAERATRLAVQATGKLHEMLRLAGLNPTSGIGQAHLGIDHITASLEEAEQMLGYRIAKGGGVFAFDWGKELKGMTCRDLEAFPQHLLSALKRADRKEVENCIEHLIATLYLTEASSRRIGTDLRVLLSALADLYLSFSHEPSTVQFENVSSCYRVLESVQSPQQLRALLSKICEHISGLIFANGSNLADRKMAEFQTYIRDHYMDTNLNLDHVGQSLQISGSYLRKLLKRMLGRTFVDFVREYRIERAKELLAGSNMTSYQVAETVGYPYAHYFSAVFKRHVGLSPSDFRNLRRKRA